MNPRCYLLLLGGLVLLGTSGCGRLSATTTIRRDGSFERRVVLTTPAPPKEKDGMTVSMGPKPEEMFLMPSGAGWKVTKVTKGENEVRTAIREVPAGGSVQNDLKILNKGKSVLANTAGIKALGDGTFEYVERLTWTGPKDEKGPISTELQTALKKVLPAALATKADLDVVTRLIGAEGVKIILGPSDPIIGLLMIHPDLAERRLRRRLGQAVITSLGRVYGGRLSVTERNRVAAALMADSFAESGLGFRDRVQSAADQGPASSSTPLPLLVVVRVPGTVLSTNGEVDSTTGEVFWGLFPEAVEFAPIDLRVRYRP